MKENEQKFTLKELSALVELPTRTVRYYIQTELIEKPGGVGRGAHYNATHLNQLLEIKKWQNAGLSLERIRELLTGENEAVAVPPPRPKRAGDIEVCSHIHIADGIELVLEPNRAGLTPEAVRELATGVMKLYDQINEKKEKGQ